LFIAGPKPPLAEKNLTDESQENDNSSKETSEESIILEDILARVKKETVVTQKNEENKEHDQVPDSPFEALEIYLYSW
jgi:hypothetical protein